MRLIDPKLSQPNEGRYPITARFAHASVEQEMPAGSVRVPADQPLGLLAASLLEPESQDSFLAWGFFPRLLAPAPNTDAYILAALGERLLETDADVKRRFEQKLKDEPAFAADPDARLTWLYAEAGRGIPIRFAIRSRARWTDARRQTARARSSTMRSSIDSGIAPASSTSWKCFRSKRFPAIALAFSRARSQAAWPIL